MPTSSHVALPSSDCTAMADPSIHAQVFETFAQCCADALKAIRLQAAELSALITTQVRVSAI